MDIADILLFFMEVLLMDLMIGTAVYGRKLRKDCAAGARGGCGVLRRIQGDLGRWDSF